MVRLNPSLGTLQREVAAALKRLDASHAQEAAHKLKALVEQAQPEAEDRMEVTRAVLDSLLAEGVIDEAQHSTFFTTTLAESLRTDPKQLKNEMRDRFGRIEEAATVAAKTFADQMGPDAGAEAGTQQSLDQLVGLEKLLEADALTAEGRAAAKELIATLVTDHPTPEKLVLVEELCPKLLDRLQLGLISQNGPQICFVKGNGTIALRQVSAANAKDVMREVKTADLELKTSSGELRQAILDRSGGTLDSSTAFTYAVDLPEGQGFWDYLDDPSSWIPERRAVHAEVINAAVFAAESFGDKVRIGTPTIFATRGNTASGKTRSLRQRVDAFKPLVDELKNEPFSTINPDAFKPAIRDWAPDSQLSHRQVHSESSALAYSALQRMFKQRRSMVVDTRMCFVSDIDALLKVAKETNRPVKLYDLDVPLAASLCGVLARDPSGGDPIPGFEVIANGFRDIRRERRSIIPRFFEHPDSTYELNRPGEDKPVLKVEGGEAEMEGDGAMVLLIGDPEGEVKAARKQVIDDAFIEETCSKYDGAYGDHMRASLERYKGKTLRQAVQAHSRLTS